MPTFQQDHARAHTARISTQYLANNVVALLEWPALSPDLSPIENIWDYLAQRISRRPQMNNLGELVNPLQQELNATPQNSIRRFIGSMRRRCMACLDAHDGETLLTFHCDPTCLSYVDELKLINDSASFFLLLFSLFVLFCFVFVCLSVRLFVCLFVVAVIINHPSIAVHNKNHLLLRYCFQYPNISW